MSIQYFHPNDEDQVVYNPWISDGSDDGWWSGVQKCAATVALAATLALSTLSTAQAQQQITWGASQDDPAGNLSSFVPDEDYCQRNLYNPNLRAYSTTGDGQLVVPIDEDFWQNPVSPVQATNLVQLPFVEKDDVPVGHLFGVPEEDFWQNPVAPAVNPPYVPQQWIFDVQEPAGSLALVVDEDYWLHLDPEIEPSPVWYWIDDSCVVTPSSFSPDEDYWQSNFVFPNQKVYGKGGGSRFGAPDEDSWQQHLPLDYPTQVTLWMDDSGTIPVPLFIEEELWQNPVAPIASYPVPRIFSDDDILVPFVPPSSLPFDEEVWLNPVAPIASYPVPRVFVDDDIWVPFVAPSTLQFDEETWQQPLGLDYNLDVTLWLDDSGTIPTPALVPDDDFWTNPVSPVIAQNAVPKYWTFDNQEPAGSLYGLDDELFWTNPTPPVPWTFGKLYLPDTNDDPAGFFEGLQDEDFWLNPVRPVQAANYIKLPLLLDPEEIPTTLFGQPDEDLWINPVPPVQYAFGRIYAPDQDDVSAGSFFVKPDEDYWINSVWPVPPYPVPIVFTDKDEIPAGSLYVHPDEDYWQNPVTPVPAVFGKLYAPDLDDVSAGSFHGQYEEDYWTSYVHPIASYPVPVVFTDDEVLFFPPLGVDEDAWLQGPTPVPAKQYIALPYLPDPEEIPAGSLIPPIPPPPINPCPCSGIPNIPKDRVYDIVLCDQGFINSVHTWLACIFAQPNSLLAQRMGAPIVTIYVYGTQAQAFQEARQFVNHNMGTM